MLEFWKIYELFSSFRSRQVCDATGNEKLKGDYNGYDRIYPLLSVKHLFYGLVKS